jgi:hypothetical protein
MTLRIRAEPLESLAQARYRDFEERATRHLRAHFPEAMRGMSAERSRAYVRECIERAGAFGLKSEQAVLCFAHLPLLLGEDFESQPRWAFVPYVLRQEQYPANDRAKVAVLLAYEAKARGL